MFQPERIAIMKSQVNAILHVLAGLVKDVQLAYPALRGLDRDMSRLSLLGQTRGLGSLSLDLPILDDILLAGLRDGRLPQDAHPFGWVSKKCRVPKLFSGLWLRVFDRDACLKPDADINAVMFLRQLCCIAKKVTAPCSDERIANALKGYLDVEVGLRSPTLNWEGDNLASEDQIKSLHLVEAVEVDLPLFGIENTERRRANSLLSKCQQVADCLLSRFSWYDPNSWSDRMLEERGTSGFKHGTGAVAAKSRSGIKSEFETWPRKLESLFPYHIFGKMPMSEATVLERELPSQMHMVPKTLKGPRIIAAEPVEHQWCQQSILGYMVHEFSRLFRGDFIDLKSQYKSGDMVLQASLDGQSATVDLSDASDRLSCFVVERMFRRNPPLLRALHAVRTRYVSYNNGRGSKDLLKFKKFASQGTGTTFPVQSLVFLIIAIASCVGSEVSWQAIMRLRRKVRVYGDDIIIPTHGYEDLKFLMTTLGLKVNDKKSFATGSFRESCGTDGFRGYDITPIRPKVFSPDGPGDVVALIDTCNNLFKKGYWHASLSLQSGIPSYAMRRIRTVGPDAPGFSGLYSFVGSNELHLSSRWNSDLQRREVRVFASYTNARGRPRDGDSGLVDLSTMAHNPSVARCVSKRPGRQYAKGGVRWEPSVATDRSPSLCQRM